ncbi:MAG: FkbM family methyltransferase [Thermoanaerobaculia bacterium]
MRKLPLPKKLGIMERLYGASLEAQGICWVKTSPGPRWKLDLADSSQRWIVFGDYEGSLQMNWIRAWLRDGGLVVDSGANIGQMLLYMASQTPARILAFEPLPSARVWLQDCLENYPTWNVEVLNCGLSDQTGAEILRDFGALSTTRSDWYTTESLAEVSIETHTLDALLEARDFPQVRLWKLDVEGGELQALNGARRNLERQRIAAVLVESGPGRFDELLRFFAEVGYSLFRIRKWGRLEPIGLGTPQTHGNLLALPAKT